MDMKFYKCDHCGNILAMVNDVGVPVVCCGQRMTELVANTEDAVQEKHVPVYEIKEGNIVEVTIGSIEHPMLEEHFIQWVALQTNLGNQRKALKPGDEPKAEFALLDGEIVESVYEYCNLHGLWKA